ncbi:PREDICTED: GON-4-like protein [Branchiostoma belcheri]|uniref:GON-4-like protein n=1 Tax=Branchiostoma belcheri TaxID=7741 RepID=A0A6P4XXP7_BRABE|nr:PREDICTED: GON-4-like protein [Branchiostoma belcheri]
MSSNKKEPPQPGEQNSSQEPTLSSTELQKTEGASTPAQTGAVHELGKTENVHDIDKTLERTESLDVVSSAQIRKYDANDKEPGPSSQPSQSKVYTATASCSTTSVTAEPDRTVNSTEQIVSEKNTIFSTLEEGVEDSRDGFSMQIVETSPGQGKNKKKAGRKRKKGEKSLKPRKLRLILPHPEGAEGEGSSAGFLDPSFESHLEDIGRNYSLSTTNVKSILHRVITNENVVAMMRHSVKEDQGEEETEGDSSPNNPLAELFEPKMTRARAKEVAEKGSFVVPWPISPVKKPADSQPAKFIDLSFEEDEDDDEYEPDDDENEESDIDSIASREASDFGSPMPSTPRQFLRTYSESDRRDDSEDTDDKPEMVEQGGKSLEPHIKIQPIPMGPPLPPLSKEKTDAAFLSELDTFDEELSELSGRTARSAMDFNAEDNLGLIANRTRSKCPLKDTPIDIIEAAFHAPDITQDMYDTECDDSEWQGWLKGLFKTDLDMSGDADDEQNDPDYNFLQEEEEVDTEDLRDDRAVRITKKEVNELMDELLQQYEEEMEQLGGDPAPGLDDSTTVDPLSPPPSRTFVKPPPISFDGPLSTVMAKTHKTVQQQLQEEKVRKKETGGGRKVQTLPVLTQGERQQLRQQMQQHVQLLCQVHVLSREEPQLQEVAQVTKNFLKENQMFVQRSTQLYEMQVEQYRAAGVQLPQVEFRSMFDTCNLQAVYSKTKQLPALPLVCPDMEAVQAVPPAHLQAKHLPEWLQPALLPTSGPVLYDPIKHGKEKPYFLPAEDNLLALGMQQYQGMSTLEMIHYIRDNMIPTKTSDQIRIRIKNLKANKKKTGNIVQVYSKTKQLPALPLVCPDMEAVQAVPPAQLQAKHLPEWLQEYQQDSQKNTEPLQCKKLRNLSPKKSEKLSPTQRGILPKGFVPVMSVKKALFQSPSKVQSTVNITSSSTTSATISTSTAENTAKTLQTLAPKSTDVSHISSIDSSTPVYIMLPSNVVPGNLSQTSPPAAVPGLQGSVQPLGGTAGGVFVVVSPTSTTASMTQSPQTVVISSTGQSVENTCLQSSLSNSTASNLPLKVADTLSTVESSSLVPTSLVETASVTSTTDPVPEQSHTSSLSVEKVAIDSREGEMLCKDSVVTSVQMQGQTPKETTASDLPLPHTTSPGLPPCKDIFTIQETATNSQASADVYVEEISTNVDEGNQNRQSPLQEATNLPESTCTGPDRSVAGTILSEERGREECKSVAEDICMTEDSSTPLKLQEIQIMQDVSEQTVRPEAACLVQPFTEQPEPQHVFVAQSDRTEMPCSEQPCTEQLQPSTPQRVEGITAHPSEEAHVDQVVSEDNPVVVDEGLVSSTEDVLAKDVEAEHGADAEGQMGEEQSATSKRMVMVKKKAKRRRKQLQKDMASTLLLLDSDLMDRDPLREERETMMAKNFLERVRDSLRDEEGKYHEVLQVFHQGHQDGKTIVQLYQELRRVLSRWPVLLGEFAAFLQPAEAVECDLFMEHQEYVQARSFLRKLEVFFSENPDHYQKVLRVFASYMREGASLEGLRQEITPLLQGQPYLLQEFTRFFPDLPPPQSMMGDFEEIHMASDSDGDEVPDSFEEIVLPEEDDEEVTREKKQVDPWKLLLAQKHGTKECRCECHESSTDLRVQRRNRHCVACNTKLTPKDLQAKKDIILRHQALLHTRESPTPDRTRRKIPAKRGRKKTDSETSRDSPSLDTAMVEESCSSPLTQDQDLVGTENSSNTKAGRGRKAKTRSQKLSAHQTSELAKFCPLGSGLETGAGEDEETRKSTNEEDAEESSQESDEELEQVTEEAVRNLRDLCEEIPAPDWQKSATIVESFRRRLQEIAQHEFTEEEEEEEEEDEDEDKLSSGDESQDAEFSDLEEASGSGSASPSSLQALSAATSPGAASQGSEESPKTHTTSGHSLESPKAHTTSGHSLQTLSAAISPSGAAFQGSWESPKALTASGHSHPGLSVTTSCGTASGGSEESPKSIRTLGHSPQGVSATASPGAAAAVTSPGLVCQVGDEAHTLTEQSETVEFEAVASQVSKESTKSSTPRGKLSTTAVSAGYTTQGTGSPKASKIVARSIASELETSKMTGTENKWGIEMGQDGVSSQHDGGDKLRQEFDEEDRRTCRKSEVSEQEENSVQNGGNIAKDDQRTGSSRSGTQSEHSDTQHDPRIYTPSDTAVTSHLGSGTSGTVEDMTAESLSQGGHKDDMETSSARHEEQISTRSENEDEKMELTEGKYEADEKNSSGDGAIMWTRDQDRTLLQACQQQGATPETFSSVAEQLGDRTQQQVTDRFLKLMALYHQGTSTDEETGTDGETEEEDGSEYSTEQDNADPIEMEDD